jgi:hypothetical protein
VRFVVPFAAEPPVEDVAPPELAFPPTAAGLAVVGCDEQLARDTMAERQAVKRTNVDFVIVTPGRRRLGRGTAPLDALSFHGMHRRALT